MISSLSDSGSPTVFTVFALKLSAARLISQFHRSDIKLDHTEVEEQRNVDKAGMSIADKSDRQCCCLMDRTQIVKGEYHTRRM